MSAVSRHSGLSKAANVAQCPSASLLVPWFWVCVCVCMCASQMAMCGEGGLEGVMGRAVWGSGSSQARRSVCGHLHWQPLQALPCTHPAPLPLQPAPQLGNSPTVKLDCSKITPLDLRCTLPPSFSPSNITVFLKEKNYMGEQITCNVDAGRLLV